MKRLINKLINREIIAYGIFGLLTTILALASFAGAVHIGLSVVAANTVSTVLAVLFAYITNKIFLFRSKVWRLTNLVTEFLTFCGSRLATFVGETALLYLLVDIGGFDPVITKAVTMVLVIIFNYVLSKWMVFRVK